MNSRPIENMNYWVGTSNTQQQANISGLSKHQNIENLAQTNIFIKVYKSFGIDKPSTFQARTHKTAQHNVYLSSSCCLWHTVSFCLVCSEFCVGEKQKLTD